MRFEIGVDESIAIHDFSCFKFNGIREHGAVVGAGVELAAFAARIDDRRQVAEQINVKLPACEGGIELAGIDADNLCAEAAGDHGVGEFVCGQVPERKKRLYAGGDELLFAVGADVAQEQVSERDGMDVVVNSAKAGFGHALLVDFV